MEIQIPGEDSNASTAYTALPEDPASPGKSPRKYRKSASTRNIFGLAREYFTGEIFPEVNGAPTQIASQEAGLRSVLSSELIYKNTMMHNTGMGDEGPISPLKPLQPGSSRTGVLTFAATALGSGLLALPIAFARVGIVAGVVILALACCFGVVSLTILMVASRYTEAKSYAELLTLSTGSSRSGLVIDVCLVLFGCAAILALLIFEGDFVPAILEALHVQNPGRTYCIIIVAFCAWPLVLPEKISALRYVTMLSPFAILFVACSVVLHAPMYYDARPAGNDPELWILDPKEMLKASSIFVFSVMCHSNAVPVANMLDRPSVERMVKVATYPNTLFFVLYALVGVGGYMSFQGSVQGDFLLNYPVDNLAFLCCRMMLAVVCYVAIPMNSSAGVAALQKLISAIAQGTAEPQVGERPLVFAFLASVVLATSTVAAIYLSDVATVISVVGGSLITIQMFWLPALVYWKLLYPTQPKVFRKWVLGSMIAAGISGFSSVACSVLA